MVNGLRRDWIMLCRRQASICEPTITKNGQARSFSRRQRARVLPSHDFFRSSPRKRGPRLDSRWRGNERRSCCCRQAKKETKERREVERRQTQCFMTRTQAAHGARHGKAACAALPLAGALACRRSTTVLAAATERHRSAPVHALPGTELDRSGCYPLPAVPVQRVAPRTGRNAGRAFWPGAARE
jgi:hypothetical protein